MDSAYYAEKDGELLTINREDESSHIDDEVIGKINRYRYLLECAFEKPVMSVITTPLPVDEPSIKIKISPKTLMDIKVISYPKLDGRKRLNKIRRKIDDNKSLTNVEAMNLVMIPKMFTSRNDEILEEVCHLLKKAHLIEEFFKHELIFEMRYVIHKYAKTLKDINRLEEVIGLQNSCIAMKQRDQHLQDKFLKQGIEQGVKKGSFELALKIKQTFGLEYALEMTDFTREELENEKLNETE